MSAISSCPANQASPVKYPTPPWTLPESPSVTKKQINFPYILLHRLCQNPPQSQSAPPSQKRDSDSPVSTQKRKRISGTACLYNMVNAIADGVKFSRL